MSDKKPNGKPATVERIERESGDLRDGQGAVIALVLPIESWRSIRAMLQREPAEGAREARPAGRALLAELTARWDAEATAGALETLQGKLTELTEAVAKDRWDKALVFNTVRETNDAADALQILIETTTTTERARP